MTDADQSEVGPESLPQLFARARSLLGQQVRVTVDRGPTVAAGRFLAVADDGSFVIEDNMDGSVHYCWPMLHIEAESVGARIKREGEDARRVVLDQLASERGDAGHQDEDGVMMTDFYVCPNHAAGGGYDPSAMCGGWDEDAEQGRLCSEALDVGHQDETPTTVDECEVCQGQLGIIPVCTVTFTADDTGRATPVRMCRACVTAVFAAMGRQWNQGIEHANAAVNYMCDMLGIEFRSDDHTEYLTDDEVRERWPETFAGQAQDAGEE